MTIRRRAAGRQSGHQDHAVHFFSSLDLFGFVLDDPFRPHCDVNMALLG
jgi:hypothetical protein